MCMAPTCLYAFTTTCRDDPDEMVDGILEDLLPGLDQGFSRL